MEGPGRPPHNLAELRTHRSGPERYPNYVIIQHNLQRTLDGDLAVGDRVESLKVVDQLGSQEPAVRSSMASLLAEASAPRELRNAALQALMRRDSPDLAGHVMKAWPALAANPELRQTALDWLSRHRSPRVLAEIVKLWASEPQTSGPNEQRFRLVVERISRKRWDQALLDALNARVFFARGSALKILTRRFGGDELRRRILSIRARTPAVEAIQFFADRFDHLPQSGSELLSCVLALRERRETVFQAERLYQSWRNDSGYRFNVRDLHLLGRLAADPLRQKHSPEELKSKISQALKHRQHALNERLSARGNFDWLAHRLTMADLWNLYLLNEMLGRKHVQLAIKIMAEGDRLDTRSQWGGLISYENGRAEAKLYTPDRTAGENDAAYAPTQAMIRDSRDSLCRFVAHFDKPDNISLAGPTGTELQDAAERNYYGLSLASISENTFSAHYYSPQGHIVSLGVYRFSER